MIQIFFTVPQVSGKGRPRFARKGTFVKTYTDAKTLTYEKSIQTYAKQAMGSTSPLIGAVAAYLHIGIPIPPSYSKTRQKACIEGLERPTKKPDIDNIVKAILDGMNGIVYLDDKQVVDLHLTKVYSETEGVDILIKGEI
jgi:Holliday junction resolvase RusA-like endonuclease